MFRSWKEENRKFHPFGFREEEKKNCYNISTHKIHINENYKIIDSYNGIRKKKSQISTFFYGISFFFLWNFIMMLCTNDDMVLCKNKNVFFFLCMTAWLYYLLFFDDTLLWIFYIVFIWTPFITFGCKILWLIWSHSHCVWICLS